jgi:hypothetical protein
MSERDRWAPCRFCVPTSLKSAVFFWSFFWRLCCFSFLSFSFCLLTQSRGWRLAFCSVSVPHRWMCGDLPLFFLRRVSCFTISYIFTLLLLFRNVLGPLRSPSPPFSPPPPHWSPPFLIFAADVRSLNDGEKKA